MTDSTGPRLDDPIDRYVRRELTPAEARELAQESLDDSEMFENLTASALAAAALASPAKVVRFPRKTRFIAAVAAAAAAVVLVLLYSMRPSQQHPLPQTVVSAQLKPSLALSASPGQPILLASGLQFAASGRDSAPVFRSPEPESRSPQAAGSIVSIEDGLATMNLGSLDGLGKGSQVEVFRDERSVGHLAVTAVFRERARARILAAARIQVNDQVRAPAAAYLDALLQQVEAQSGRGDSVAASTTAEKAAAWAETANVPSVELERLASLEYQLGSLQLAERHYQSAGPQASFGALNNLAVLRILRGDYDGAEAPLNRVVSTSSKTDTEYASSVNNLGVLAEIHGDQRKAAELYAKGLLALTGARGSPERQALEANLARIRGVH
ncbi:MAG TPA: tetratricopeptide repeat protein [Bryobacteraceae bacterium]|nr:tetratricopeptide repeat protein [Bryobacteraceae bacterium]